MGKRETKKANGVRLKSDTGELCLRCKRPPSDRVGKGCRGMCFPCYITARAGVKDGRWSWAQLIAAGVAREPMMHGPRPKATLAQFLARGGDAQA